MLFQLAHLHAATTYVGSLLKICAKSKLCFHYSKILPSFFIVDKLKFVFLTIPLRIKWARCVVGMVEMRSARKLNKIYRITNIFYK